MGCEEIVVENASVAAPPNTALEYFSKSTQVDHEQHVWVYQ